MSAMSSLRRQLTDYHTHKQKRIAEGRRRKLARVSKVLAMGDSINERTRTKAQGIVARLRAKLLPRRAA